MKPKKFNIKPKDYVFSDAEFLSASEKEKIYIDFIRFLNNHFKETLFKKNLYKHFHLHCGFIAHYNIHGFYSEYFETPAHYHFLKDGTVPSCGACLDSDLKTEEAFVEIYKELIEQREGLGMFYRTIMSNRNWAGFAAYKDLDDAIKEAFDEYLAVWKDLLSEKSKPKVKKVNKKFNKSKNINN